MLCDFKIVEYSLEPVDSVNEKLKAGYQLYGNPVYDTQKQRYLQPIVLAAQNGTLPGPIPKIHLTEKEAQCLYWAAQGEVPKGIAKKLGNSVYTVNRHLFKLRLKFNSVSTQQLIIQAVQWGYIVNGKIKKQRKLR